MTTFFQRNLSIDTLRGIAIVLMVLANFSGEHLAHPHPMWLRFVGSLAAPAFICLCGLMLGMAYEKKQANFSYFLKRSAILMGTAFGIDVLVWRAVPFIYVDVLHLLGVGVLLVYGVLRLPRFLQWVVAAIILGVTPFMQQSLGYIPVPTFIELAHLTSFPSVSVLLNHWIVDGWFPLFPWLSLLLFGAMLVPLKDRYDVMLRDQKAWVRVGCLVVFAASFIFWIFFPGLQILREGYSELFYPPTIGFIVSMAMMIVTSGLYLEMCSHYGVFKPLQLLGRNSLFIYVLHLAMIVYLFPEGALYTLPLFLLFYACLMGGVFVLSLVRRR